jgi:hypothetical protein
MGWGMSGGPTLFTNGHQKLKWPWVNMSYYGWESDMKSTCPLMGNVWWSPGFCGDETQIVLLEKKRVQRLLC